MFHIRKCWTCCISSDSVAFISLKTSKYVFLIKSFIQPRFHAIIKRFSKLQKKTLPWLDFLGLLICCLRHVSASKTVGISSVAVKSRLTYLFSQNDWTITSIAMRTMVILILLSCVQFSQDATTWINFHIWWTAAWLSFTIVSGVY